MAGYKVSGELETGISSVLPVVDSQVAVRQAVRLESAVRDGGPVVDLDLADDDLLELELESGFVLWTTFEQLREDTFRAGLRKRGDKTFPSRYPLQQRGVHRGTVSDVINAVRVLGVDIPKSVAQIVADKIEGQLAGDGQFFRIDEHGGLTREDPATTAPDEPSLVLVHGTFSSTLGGYGGLFNENADVWQQIHEYYQGRVFGFDHRTLSADPIENALEFLAAVPKGANLHLVSHSRGGLVSDLIAHGGVAGDAFAADDLKRELGRAFGDKPATLRAQLARYQQFNRRLKEVAPNVTRFVRVACPAAGTTLASGRTDVYLSILINLLRQVPGVGPLLGGLGELVAAVAKERAKVDALPGLEAQRPKSAFIRLLNGSPHVLDTDLTVLAGDSDGLLKNLANLFYWRANDLVVDTRSMYGGAPRARRLWHLEENRHVTHMNYFRRAETARIVQRGLLRHEDDTTGFQTRKPRGVRRGGVAEGLPDEQVDRPGVILLPGIMGSNLAAVRGEKRDTIWLDKLDILRGRGDRLAVDSGHKIEPHSVLDSPYESFRDFLVRDNIHVMPMAYDWRLSLVDAAAALDKRVRARLVAAPGKPLHLIAHSMGGLVASLFMVRHAATWADFKQAGGRLVQAGTPNLGSYVIPRILQGREPLVRTLAALDFSNRIEDWLAWIAEFPGLLELAPSFGGPDFSKVATWKQMGAKARPTGKLLRTTARVRDVLARQTLELASEPVLYVAGGPRSTPVWDSAAGELAFTDRGDGRVTWESGIPPGVPSWYLPVSHGSLLDTRRAFGGLQELIFDGHTDQIASEAPPASSLFRGEPLDVPELAADEQIEFVPSQEDLEAAVLDMAPAFIAGDEDTAPVAPCEVSVVHGDLRFCSAAVMVGHYRGDQIVHAEAVLDQCLGGALRARHQLDVYPGEIGTADVVLRQRHVHGADRSPTGAIILGLGHVGELTPGGLTRAVEAGLLRYAQAVRERGGDATSLKVAALLVGTGEAGVSTPEAVEAFLLAVVNANQALQALTAGDDDDNTTKGNRPLVRIAQLELIELFEDTALEALHVLAEMRPRTGIYTNLDLVRRDGGERRPRSTEAQAWWPRVQIKSGRPKWTEQQQVDDDERVEALSYTAFGLRAGAAVEEVIVQKPLVDRLVEEAIADRIGRDSRLPAALFELLVPPAFKAASAARHRIHLVLDEGAAAYPWELLVDREQVDSEAPGIGAALLRQLRLEDIRQVSHPEDNQILVVGDPPSGMVDLPGARAEAEIVADRFDRGDNWKIWRQIRGVSTPLSASSIIEHLMTHDIRVLHLAGHGVYDAKRPWRSGMVIGGSGDAQDPFSLITASEVSHMRLLPELVFINCCHLGRVEKRLPFHKLAASLATAFIKRGVKAVVAAGWPVEDEAAKTFCDEFYRKMLSGSDFGDAVGSARARTRARHSNSNTWGAYQCYGDPGYRLLMDIDVRARATGSYFDPNQYLTPGELVVELGNLRERAKVRKNDDEKTGTRLHRDALWSYAQSRKWSRESGVLAGFARVAGELGEFERAIELYVAASGEEAGGATLTDLEQLANYRARLGEKLGKPGMIDAAIDNLEDLARTHGDTAERFSLIGSAYKRLAQTTKSETRIKRSLRKMTEAYIAAAERNASNRFYAASNALLGVVLLGGPWRSKPGNKAASTLYTQVAWCRTAEFEQQADAVALDLRRRDIREFWDAIGGPDLAVVRALATSQPDKALPDLVAEYRHVISLYGSGRQVDSVINQWAFAAHVVNAVGPESKRKFLAALRAALQELGGG